MSAPQRPSKRRRHWSLSVGQIGSQFVLAALIGLIALMFLPRPATLESEILSLDPIDYQSLASGALSDSDEYVVIMARIASNNNTNEHGFVAYQHERSVIDIRDQKIWVPESSSSPALTLEMEDGSFSVLSDYSFGGDLHTIESEKYRFQGLQIGDELVVYGRLFSNRDTIIVNASYLFVGDYTDLRIRSIPFLRIIISAIGLIVGFTILSLLWRAGYRPFDAYKQASTHKQT